MVKRSLAETTEWVADNLRGSKDVLNVEVLSEQVLRISRRKLSPFVAGILSTECVDEDVVKPLMTSDFEVEIIANVPKESFWTGQALRSARANRIATGAYGDLLRVINCANVRSYQPKETEFIERGLRQHDRISTFERVHDRLYLISRNGLPNLTVVMLNEYELTADHIRTARDRYGRFSLVIITNPNGRSTGSATEVAESTDIEILKWGPFFGRLNKQ